MEGSNDEKKSDKYDMVNEENEVSQKYHKGITENVEEMEDDKNDEKIWRCEHCDKDFTHKNNYYRHLKHYCAHFSETVLNTHYRLIEKKENLATEQLIR